jgi:hypothetical protein
MPNITFNVNDTVRVQLTTKGRVVHRENHRQSFMGYSAAWIERNCPYKAPDEDAQGWSEWKLWDLMHEFGREMYMGNDPPFKTTIELVVKK